MSLAIAIIPSNQETNTSKVKPEYNEYGGMKYLANMLCHELSIRGVEAFIVPIASEKLDTYPLQGLIEAMESANKFLFTSRASEKVIISLHTDSGNFSHTFGISDGTRWGSEIAAILATITAGCLQTDEVEVFSQRGGIDYKKYVFAKNTKHPSALLEVCSHENADDIGKLWLMSQELARQLALGCISFQFGIGYALQQIDRGVNNTRSYLRGD